MRILVPVRTKWGLAGWRSRRIDDIVVEQQERQEGADRALGRRIREKNKDAARRSREARATDADRAIRDAAINYRRKYPDRSRREMAKALGRHLERKENTIRAALRRLKIR
jgi:hypothetical protein